MIGINDLQTYLILAALTLIPAAIVFTIATIQRRRRSKFHRQRIPSRSKKPEDGSPRPD
jgi:hypothetical protein